MAFTVLFTVLYTEKGEIWRKISKYSSSYGSFRLTIQINLYFFIFQGRENSKRMMPFGTKETTVLPQVTIFETKVS
jgi:hypothetical protein